MVTVFKKFMLSVTESFKELWIWLSTSSTTVKPSSLLRRPSLSPEQFAAAKKAMEEVVAASLPRTSATIKFDEGYPALAPTPGNERLLALYNRASLDVGAGPVIAVDPDKAGAADVSFIAGQAKMILDGVGLMGRGGHTVDETADLRTLPSMTKRMAVLLARVQRDGAK